VVRASEEPDVAESSETVRSAASALLCDLLDGSGPLAMLREVARTRVAVHYETGRADVPVLSVCTPAAVRLPASVLAPVVPSGSVHVRDGELFDGAARWQVTRWWTPPRPHGLTAPVDLAAPLGVERIEALVPHDLVGSGPGLTPSGDDVLAGALVAAHATSDPRLPQWRAETRAALRARRTTVVSRGLLHHAMDGYATPELAAFVTAVCAGEGERAAPALLAVGHTSGAALAAGVLHVLRTRPDESAAA
jgi:hypothetical protein